MMIHCKAASRLMSQALDRELAPMERTRLRFHLFLCSACSRAKKQFDFLHVASKEFPGPDGDGGPRNP